MPAKKKIDYSRLEPAWRAGVMSPDEMAGEYERLTGIRISRVAIIKYFTKMGIPRSLAPKIQAQAEHIAIREALPVPVDKNQFVAERELVVANAEIVAGVMVRHKKEIARYQKICDELFAELEAAPRNRGLGELQLKADIAKKLIESKCKLIALERISHGMKDTAPAEDKEPVQFILNMGAGSTTQVAVVAQKND